MSHYDMWFNAYNTHLQNMYTIYTGAKSNNKLTFKQFASFIYTHSSGYITEHV